MLHLDDVWNEKFYTKGSALIAAVHHLIDLIILSAVENDVQKWKEQVTISQKTMFQMIIYIEISAFGNFNQFLKNRSEKPVELYAL